MRARAAKRDGLAGVPLLDLDAAFAPRASDGSALLTGTPASRGTATGTVRVIMGPEGFGELRAGEIMVCPYTSPSWTAAPGASPRPTRAAEPHRSRRAGRRRRSSYQGEGS